MVKRPRYEVTSWILYDYFVCRYKGDNYFKALFITWYYKRAFKGGTIMTDWKYSTSIWG